MKKLIISIILSVAAAYGQAQPVKRVVRCTDSSGGGNDTYTATAAPALGAYSADQWLEIRVLTANTGTASFDCGPGAKTLVKLSGGVSTTLADNDLVPKGTYIGVYNATDDNIKIISQVGTAAGGTSVGTIWIGNHAGNTVSSGVTTYAAPFAGAFTTTENQRQWMVTTACTLRNLFFRTSATQSASADLVVTVRKNAVATAITQTVAASAPAGTFSDTTNTNSAAAGDRISIQLAEGAATSTGIFELSLQCN